VRAPAWAAGIPGPRDPLPSHVEQFLDYLRVQRNRPETTVRTYRAALAKFAAYCRARGAGEDICACIGKPMLRRYQIELADVLPNPRTRAGALVALRQFLRYAYDEELVAQELSRAVVLPAYTVGDPHPLPSSAVNPLLRALPRETLRDLRDRALVHFLISTGCRVAEAVAVDRAEVRPEGFRVLGKGGKHRTVYLTEDAWEAVMEYLAVRGRDPEPALFVNFWHPETARARGLPYRARLSCSGVSTAWATLRQRVPLMAGLRSPHAARHTAATTLLEATNGDVRLVQEVLGHATLETLRVYTEITDRRKRAAYARLGNYLRDQVTAASDD
jgi:integrase/recombinase XerD